MVEFTYTLVLKSDATPGTGLGGRFVNEHVTRDHTGVPVIAASHLKGLIRWKLEEIAALAGEGIGDSVDVLLGREGRDSATGDASGLISLTDARFSDPGTDAIGGEPSSESTRLISRTKISEHGTAAHGALRTEEAIRVGSRFQGRLSIDAPADSAPVLLAKLGMLSIDSIGSNRTRGMGQCFIEIDGQGGETPGHLLAGLATAPPYTSQTPRPAGDGVSQQVADQPRVWLRVVFQAEQPVCVPTSPIVSQNNVIASGFTIPASAVQGFVLNRINAEDASLASACFESTGALRAWPLLPTAETVGDVDGVSDLDWPVQVPLSHRMSKHVDPETDKPEFRDTAIEPYDWKKIAGNSPLKGTQGVLLRKNDDVRLWKSGDMARVISAHVRVSGEKNLFTVEAMAPVCFSGLVCLPRSAADVLTKSVTANPRARFGKAKSVRGNGSVRIEEVDAIGVMSRWMREGEPSSLAGRVFVTQSPVVIPDDLETAGMTTHDLLEQLTKASSLGPLELKISSNGEASDFHATQATAGLRFGWSRFADRGRLRAVRVIEPGGVFVLKTPVGADKLADVLMRGLGETRGQAMGAILPHPGMAQDVHERHAAKPPVLKSRVCGAGDARELLRMAGGRGPTPSQISRLLADVERKPKLGIEYLDGQAVRNSSRIQEAWQPVESKLREMLEDASTDNERADTVVAALRAWRDLTVGSRNENGKETSR